MQYLSYLSIGGWGFTVFCIVFHVWNATLICVSLKSFVALFVSLPLYVKVVHLFHWCCGSVFYVYVDWSVSCLGLCYVHYYVVRLMEFSSLSFASFVIEYVCLLFIR
jgi:hypothetical protein